MTVLATAQTPDFNNSVQVHLEVLTMKGDQRAPSPVPKYSLLYARKLSTSRWLVETGVSYTNRTIRGRVSPSSSERTQLLTLDLSLLYNLLLRHRHSLRVGLGPSLWYTRNSALNNLIGIVPVSGGQLLELVSYERAANHDFNLALSLRGSYEYSLGSRVILGVRASLGGNVLRGDGLSVLGGSLATTGLSVGYRF